MAWQEPAGATRRSGKPGVTVTGLLPRGGVLAGLLDHERSGAAMDARRRAPSCRRDRGGCGPAEPSMPAPASSRSRCPRRRTILYAVTQRP